jgi:hypothetical protein
MRMIGLAVVLALACLRLDAAVVEHDKTDISLEFFVPCAADGIGETVQVSGTLHLTISFTVNGNNAMLHNHSQPELSGTGLTTGTRYHTTDIIQESFKSALDKGQANLTFVNNFHLIGQGPGSNLSMHETLHETLNGNGTVTVYHDNFSIDCK